MKIKVDKKVSNADLDHELQTQVIPPKLIKTPPITVTFQNKRLAPVLPVLHTDGNSQEHQRLLAQDIRRSFNERFTQNLTKIFANRGGDHTKLSMQRVRKKVIQPRVGISIVEDNQENNSGFEMPCLSTLHASSRVLKDSSFLPSNSSIDLDKNERGNSQYNFVVMVPSNANQVSIPDTIEVLKPTLMSECDKDLNSRALKMNIEENIGKEQNPKSVSKIKVFQKVSSKNQLTNVVPQLSLSRMQLAKLSNNPQNQGKDDVQLNTRVGEMVDKLKQIEMAKKALRNQIEQSQSRIGSEKPLKNQSFQNSQEFQNYKNEILSREAASQRSNSTNGFTFKQNHFTVKHQDLNQQPNRDISETRGSQIKLQISVNRSNIQSRNESNDVMIAILPESFCQSILQRNEREPIFRRSITVNSPQFAKSSVFSSNINNACGSAIEDDAVQNFKNQYGSGSLRCQCQQEREEKQRTRSNILNYLTQSQQQNGSYKGTQIIDPSTLFRRSEKWKKKGQRVVLEKLVDNKQNRARQSCEDFDNFESRSRSRYQMSTQELVQRHLMGKKRSDGWQERSQSVFKNKKFDDYSLQNELIQEQTTQNLQDPKEFNIEQSIQLLKNFQNERIIKNQSFRKKRSRVRNLSNSQQEQLYYGTVNSPLNGHALNLQQNKSRDAKDDNIKPQPFVLNNYQNKKLVRDSLPAHLDNMPLQIFTPTIQKQQASKKSKNMPVLFREQKKQAVVQATLGNIDEFEQMQRQLQFDFWFSQFGKDYQSQDNETLSRAFEDYQSFLFQTQNSIENTMTTEKINTSNYENQNESHSMNKVTTNLNSQGEVTLNASSIGDSNLTKKQSIEQTSLLTNKEKPVLLNGSRKSVTNQDIAHVSPKLQQNDSSKKKAGSIGLQRSKIEQPRTQLALNYYDMKRQDNPQLAISQQRMSCQVQPIGTDLFEQKQHLPIEQNLSNEAIEAKSAIITLDKLSLDVDKKKKKQGMNYVATPENNPFQVDQRVLDLNNILLNQKSKDLKLTDGDLLLINQELLLQETGLRLEKVREQLRGVESLKNISSLIPSRSGYFGLGSATSFNSLKQKTQKGQNQKSVGEVQDKVGDYTEGQKSLDQHISYKNKNFVHNSNQTLKPNVPVLQLDIPDNKIKNTPFNTYKNLYREIVSNRINLNFSTTTMGGDKSASSTNKHQNSEISSTQVRKRGRIIGGGGVISQNQKKRQAAKTPNVERNPPLNIAYDYSSRNSLQDMAPQVDESNNNLVVQQRNIPQQSRSNLKNLDGTQKNDLYLDFSSSQQTAVFISPDKKSQKQTVRLDTRSPINEGSNMIGISNQKPEQQFGVQKIPPGSLLSDKNMHALGIHSITMHNKYGLSPTRHITQSEQKSKNTHQHQFVHDSKNSGNMLQIGNRKQSKKQKSFRYLIGTARISETDSSDNRIVEAQQKLQSLKRNKGRTGTNKGQLDQSLSNLQNKIRLKSYKAFSNSKDRKDNQDGKESTLYGCAYYSLDVGQELKFADKKSDASYVFSSSVSNTKVDKISHLIRQEDDDEVNTMNRKLVNKSINCENNSQDVNKSLQINPKQQKIKISSKLQQTHANLTSSNFSHAYASFNKTRHIIRRRRSTAQNENSEPMDDFNQIKQRSSNYKSKDGSEKHSERCTTEGIFGVTGEKIEQRKDSFERMKREARENAEKNRQKSSQERSKQSYEDFDRALVTGYKRDSRMFTTQNIIHKPQLTFNIIGKHNRQERVDKSIERSNSIETQKDILCIQNREETQNTQRLSQLPLNLIINTTQPGSIEPTSGKSLNQAQAEPAENIYQTKGQQYLIPQLSHSRDKNSQRSNSRTQRNSIVTQRLAQKVSTLNILCPLTYKGSESSIQSSQQEEHLDFKLCRSRSSKATGTSQDESKENNDKLAQTSQILRIVVTKKTNQGPKEKNNSSSGNLPKKQKHSSKLTNPKNLTVNKISNNPSNMNSGSLSRRSLKRSQHRDRDGQSPGGSPRNNNCNLRQSIKIVNLNESFHHVQEQQSKKNSTHFSLSFCQQLVPPRARQTGAVNMSREKDKEQSPESNRGRSISMSFNQQSPRRKAQNSPQTFENTGLHITLPPKDLQLPLLNKRSPNQQINTQKD